jgi:starch phosphorylase
MIDTTEIENRLEGKIELPSPLLPLEQLSWNYWWSWAPDGLSIFRDLDPQAWEECEHNPRQLFLKTSAYRLAQVATDPHYLQRIASITEKYKSYIQRPQLWSPPEGHSPITRERPVAYFCAEYGVHNSLPLYSGGLGILAGDHLKSASDINLPLVAVGLLYRYGYFRQRLRKDGWQEEYYGETHPTELPIKLVRTPKGQPLTIEVMIRGRRVLAQVWRADVGRVPLYLLDTNIPANAETDRWVTGHLYGGDRETRIVQEMLLGIGGVRLLRELGIMPQVFHLNEGHSAFLTLELSRELIQSEKTSFADAAARVRQQCVFTTHTPVAAGNDEFDVTLVSTAFGQDYVRDLGLTLDEFLALGRVDRKNKDERFGLTPMAIRMCRSTNGVSRKHGEVSRALWQKVWPGKQLHEIPITHVTNGVHAPTWVSPLLRDLFERHIAADWETHISDRPRWESGVARIPAEELWKVHTLLKQRLVAFISHRISQAKQLLGTVDFTEPFDPNVLTIGFARRVAEYKRWNLLLTDVARLSRLMNNEQRPVQFVFAGKAHPQDEGAKRILKQLNQWQYGPSARERAVFLEDYDQEIARQLVHSVDVWLNVPRRPLEASGTSGEKVAMNGGLNLSILDGWWLEAYDGTNGFAIGSNIEKTTAGTDVDLADAESLYRVLEEEVVPLYYDREADGLPHKWVTMMKRAIQTLGPDYNSDRMVDEYARRIYSRE